VGSALKRDRNRSTARGKPDVALVEKVMRSLAEAITGLQLPAVEKISEEQAEEPFQILIATLLSARTQDATTHAASTRLFRRARTAKSMAKLSVNEIQRLIYPVSFYRNKARHVKACCQMLLDRFGGRVPSTMEELVTLPGVGRKTANLVLILGFKSHQNICVDTHVHRISNRLGWVRTRQPEETEQALYRATDARWWPYINLYLVTWGQNVCRPIGPRCGDCVIAEVCPRIGVQRVRVR
jgi:endonuclease III